MKVVVSYSGGMDSYTLLHDAVHQGHEVSALSFNYRQRHVVELENSVTVCEMLGVPHQLVDIEFLHELASNSALTHGMDVPEGHYTDASMRKTVVPNRNMVFTSIAIAHAVNLEMDEVWLGQHAGDHAVYPDCRPAFVALMDGVAQIANWHPVRVRAPYQDLDKTGILTRGQAIGLGPHHYADTWTCYQPQGYTACGKCGSCTERLEAFDAVGWADPLEYAQ